MQNAVLTHRKRKAKWYILHIFVYVLVCSMQNFSRVFRVKNTLKSSFLATKCCIFGNKKWRINDKIER